MLTFVGGYYLRSSLLRGLDYMNTLFTRPRRPHMTSSSLVSEYSTSFNEHFSYLSLVWHSNVWFAMTFLRRSGAFALNLCTLATWLSFKVSNTDFPLNWIRTGLCFVYDLKTVQQCKLLKKIIHWTRNNIYRIFLSPHIWLII